MRVGDQILHWEEGEMIIFDESFEHEVFHYNENNESRLVLYFDFWHPDLRPEQRIGKFIFQFKITPTDGDHLNVNSTCFSNHAILA